MEKTLVTGAHGLVGHSVCEQLRAAGRPFTAIDVRAAAEDGYAVEAVDVRDVHSLYAVFDRDGPFGAIIHCGALSGPMLARDNPVLVHEINITGTVNLLEIARVKKLRRVVLCSSVSAYGSTPVDADLVRENTPLLASTVYGASKAACEAIAHGYAVQHGVDTISLRIGWVYGPRRSTDCDLREMILAGLSNAVFSRPQGLATMRQYVHVEDIARALILACAVPSAPRRAYNANGGSYLSLPNIAALVAKAVPGLVTKFGPGWHPEEDVQGRFDLTAAETDLGYTPSVSLDDGIARYAEWLKAHLPG